MAPSLVLLLAFLIGAVCGLRSMTGPALVCWGAYLGWLNVSDSRLAFLRSTVSLIVFSFFAVGELAADKLPNVPRRTAAGPLVWRVLMGGVCGAAFAITGDASLPVCSLLGGLGGLFGAFAGYAARRAATADGKLRDLPVALFEDLIAIAGGLFLISRF